MENSLENLQDAKQVFRKCGTCSQTFGHLLNREFGHPKGPEEKALDPLAGGILNRGHQCGMLWGAALAVGAEAYRKHKDIDKAVAVALTATEHIVKSFVDRTSTVNCCEITGYDLSSVFGLVKFGLKTMLVGMNNSPCFNLAEQWAPEAIVSATEGLSEEIKLTQKPKSCATEVAKRMGASEEEMVMVAGFAGGLGLQGHACGALGTAIWMKTLAWCKEHPGKSPPFFNNPMAKKILKAFNEVTNNEMLCSKITGQSFETVNDHSEFINNGGCEDLIEVLGGS